MNFNQFDSIKQLQFNLIQTCSSRIWRAPHIVWRPDGTTGQYGAARFADGTQFIEPN